MLRVLIVIPRLLPAPPLLRRWVMAWAANGVRGLFAARSAPRYDTGSSGVAPAAEWRLWAPWEESNRRLFWRLCAQLQANSARRYCFTASNRRSSVRARHSLSAEEQGARSGRASSRALLAAAAQRSQKEAEQSRVTFTQSAHAVHRRAQRRLRECQLVHTPHPCTSCTPIFLALLQWHHAAPL
jgi:hypothetical protein